jgi:hypothetical protein
MRLARRKQLTHADFDSIFGVVFERGHDGESLDIYSTMHNATKLGSAARKHFGEGYGIR